MKKALITGITGQDGSYLSEFLLKKGYEVYGIIRRSSSFNTGRIDPIYQDPHVPQRSLHLVYGDLNDASSLNRILRTVQPDEIARSSKSLNGRRRRSIRAAPMAQQKCIRIGSRSTIGRRTISLLAMAFCSTTNRPAAEKRL